MKILKYCKLCGKPFYISPSRKNIRTYCSWKCYSKKIKIICKQCKKIFHVQRFRENNAKFCSGSCRGKFYKGTISPHYGCKHSDEVRQRMSQNRKNKMTGSSHFRFKGYYKDFYGYVHIYCPNHPRKTCRKYVREHHLIAEKYLKRYIKSTERIHHINNIKTDNRVENLYLFKNESEHQKHHHNPILLKSNLTY